jgi:hypothetical protein
MKIRASAMMKLSLCAAMKDTTAIVKAAKICRRHFGAVPTGRHFSSSIISGNIRQSSKIF